MTVRLRVQPRGRRCHDGAASCAGPSRARKHLEKELLENRAKQRRLAEELG